MRTRTPPPTEPNGWEKSDSVIFFRATATEKLLWQAVFGKGQLADTARKLLNHEARRRSGSPAKRAKMV